MKKMKFQVSLSLRIELTMWFSTKLSDIQLTSCASLFSIHVSLLFSIHGMPLFYLRLCYM